MSAHRLFIAFLLLGMPLYILVACCNTPENGESSQHWIFDQTDSINTVSTGDQFEQIIEAINVESGALCVFDIDNTLLITNDNKFGSDWWFSESSDDKGLRLNITNPCLYKVLTPMFYAVFDTKPVFEDQPESLRELPEHKNKVLALTSRAYSPVVSSSTELELSKNLFDFMGSNRMTLRDSSILLNDIIYTGGKDKGVALLDYLKTHPYTKIYYFDDSMSKVENVQKAFKGAGREISLFHMEIAPKVPYTEKERRYMKEKLCIVIESLNNVGDTVCKCAN